MSETFATKAIPGQLNVDEAEGIVECFVAGIGNKDSVGDIVMPGAFEGSLKRRRPRVVWGHDWNHPIGKVLEIYEVGPADPRLPSKMRAAGIGGLFARVQFNLKSERGREAFANVVFFGGDQEWSIGYKTLKADYDNARQANLLREVELYEVSPVLHGANQLTATISIKADNGDDRVTSFKKSKWPMFDRQFAAMIKEEHPRIWDAGGNIKGDDQYEILTRIAEQGGVANTEDQIKALELREAWIARHEGDFRLPGVIAQIKWLAIGSRGEGHMKDVVREAIKKAETKGYGYGGYGRDDSSDDDPMEELGRIAARMRMMNSENDDEEEEDENEPEETPMTNDAMGRRAVLARALANEMRTPVKIRTITGNTVVFDVMGEDDEEITMRASWHAERGQVMIGRPERVRVETVYIPVRGDMEGEAYMGDEEIKAPVPPDVIPQERITGDVLRGYGPRRGNLERLLRYWRPIMRREGGFRRCLVILANHPELYPLQNICAWLHHETTGLWPNEGCHHPGMKNCRRKLRGVVRGSLWSDSEFNDRLDRLKPGRGKGMPDPFDDEMEKEYGEVTDDDVMFANKVLDWFVGQEKEFMDYIGNDENWLHEGEDEEGSWSEHEWVKPENAPEGVSGKPGGCGCGCGGIGGKGSCGDLPKSIEESLSALQEKVGRTLNSRNAQKISQAIDLLTEVIGGSAPASIERKAEETYISADIEDLFELRESIDPVLEYYGLEAEIDESGIAIKGLDDEDAFSAIESAVSNFEEIQVKGIGRSLGHRGGRFIPHDGDGDGFFSPGPGLPDKTPVSQLPNSGRGKKFSDMTDDELWKEVDNDGLPRAEPGTYGLNPLKPAQLEANRKRRVDAANELMKRGHSKEKVQKRLGTAGFSFSLGRDGSRESAQERRTREAIEEGRPIPFAPAGGVRDPRRLQPDSRDLEAVEAALGRRIVDAANDADANRRRNERASRPNRGNRAEDSNPNDDDMIQRASDSFSRRFSEAMNQERQQGKPDPKKWGRYKKEDLDNMTDDELADIVKKAPRPQLGGNPLSGDDQYGWMIGIEAGSILKKRQEEARLAANRRQRQWRGNPEISNLGRPRR